MVFIRLVSRLPLRLLYLLSDFLFLIIYHVVGYRRKLVQKNLRASFPDKPAEALHQIEKKFYRNLCDYAVEMVKLVTISEEELSARMKFNGMELLEKFKHENQSILFLASHHFNWEWLLVSASACFPIEIDFVYQPVKNKFFNRLSLETRSRFGAYAIKRDEVAREMIRRQKVIRGVATVADQYPGYGHDKKFITTFLSQETAFFYGTNQLAILTQYPAVYYPIRKIKRGYYEASPVLVAMPPYEKSTDVVIENYVRLVEQTVIESPESWLWSHNRWKKRHLNPPV